MIKEIACFSELINYRISISTPNYELIFNIKQNQSYAEYASYAQYANHANYEHYAHYANYAKYAN